MLESRPLPESPCTSNAERCSVLEGKPVQRLIHGFLPGSSAPGSQPVSRQWECPNISGPMTGFVASSIHSLSEYSEEDEPFRSEWPDVASGLQWD